MQQKYGQLFYNFQIEFVPNIPKPLQHFTFVCSHNT